MVDKTKNNTLFQIILIVLAAFALFALVSYYNSKQNVVKAEKFYEDTLQKALPLQRSYSNNNNNSQKSAPVRGGDSRLPSQYSAISNNNVGSVSSVQPSEEKENEMSRPIDFTSQKVPGDCFPKDRLTADDLLPSDAANSKWAQVNPAGQGDVKDQNYLTAGALVGIDTVGSTLRNSSYDLRSETPNPRGMWPIMNSTIEPNVFRRPLEIGTECDAL
jgi:hypothetical protein